MSGPAAATGQPSQPSAAAPAGLPGPNGAPGAALAAPGSEAAARPAAKPAPPAPARESLPDAAPQGQPGPDALAEAAAPVAEAPRDEPAQDTTPSPELLPWPAALTVVPPTLAPPTLAPPTLASPIPAPAAHDAGPADPMAPAAPAGLAAPASSPAPPASSGEAPPAGAAETGFAAALPADGAAPTATDIAPPRAEDPLPGSAAPAAATPPSGTGTASPAPAAPPAPPLAGAAAPLPQAYRPAALPAAQQLGHAVLGISLRGGAGLGPSRVSVALQPEALGRVEISIEQAADGPAEVRLLAERPDTLLLLLRDSAAIETALQQAGLGAETGRSLSFGLAPPSPDPAGGQPAAAQAGTGFPQGGAQQQPPGDGRQGRPGHALPAGFAAPDSPADEAGAPPRRRLLDLAL
ncbi:flagellar hook-length control protein FliK [Pseudoroseomonas cervicalis]|uniref:flagellar hook-length control protein FliK n=1 Tax=Teichococcus cervicalis TaxID=204525 RepID=UPI0027D82320|nr:flagellar hook-length control protein FliK [Pseudoroseomonas cervicalis]